LRSHFLCWPSSSEGSFDLIMTMLSKIQLMSVVRFLEAKLIFSFIFSTICLLYFLSFLI